jgi:hypothetical protein
MFRRGLGGSLVHIRGTCDEQAAFLIWTTNSPNGKLKHRHSRITESRTCQCSAAHESHTCIVPIVCLVSESQFKLIFQGLPGNFLPA